MKNLHKIVLALGAVATFGASAEIYTGKADQDRRERNREEALANYRSGATSARTAAPAHRHESTPSSTASATDSVKRGAHNVAESTRDVTHKSADAVRGAGHKTAKAARDFTDKTNAKFGGTTGQGKVNPDGINPVGMSSASPNAPSAGVTK